MLALKSAMEARGWSVDVLVYDGIMVRRREGVVVTDALLAELAAEVASATGYSLCVTEKPMIGLDLVEIADADEKQYNAMRSTFEMNHYYYKSTGTVVEVSAKGLEHYSLDHARAAFNTLHLPTRTIHGKPELFITKWLADPHRRIVTDLVFKFSEDCAVHEATLFAGFAFDHMIKREVEPMEDAVREFEDLLSSACRDEPQIVTYVRNTFAHMIQFPFDRTGVCIIFSSEEQGTGKDTVLGIINRVIGDTHTAHYTDDESFWEKHDTQKEGAIMMYLEEAGVAANKAKSEALKARITSSTVPVNPKGIKAYKIPNIARYFMTTNNAVPVKFEATDRRFLLINPSTRLQKGPAFWADVYSRVERESFTVAIGTYLRSVDLTGWNSRDMPSTDIRDMVMEVCVENDVEFLRHWNEKTVEKDVWILGKDLYIAFRTWCAATGVDNNLSKQSFLGRIGRYKGKYYRTELQRANVRWYCPIAAL